MRQPDNISYRKLREATREYELNHENSYSFLIAVLVMRFYEIESLPHVKILILCNL